MGDTAVTTDLADEDETFDGARIASRYRMGEPRTRRVFQRDAAGRISGFVERRESWDLPWRRVDLRAVTPA